MTTHDPAPPRADLDEDALAVNAMRGLARALRDAAVELRGPVLARDSALYAAGSYADELADLIAPEE